MRPVRLILASGNEQRRTFISNLLSEDPELEVVACARDAAQLLASLTRESPDIVVADLDLQGHDFELTRRIMGVRPTPVLLFAEEAAADDPHIAVAAVDAGALSVTPSPDAGTGWEARHRAATFKQRIKLLAEVRLVTRYRPTQVDIACRTEADIDHRTDSAAVVVIGASTGGPAALQALLRCASSRIPVPIVVTQHMAPGFIGGLAEWLAESTSFPTSVAIDQEPMLPGHVYLAPDLHHLEINYQGRFSFSDSAPVSGIRPAVSILFRSACEAFGARCIGILLSGMGNDGADELLALRKAGALTFAQSEESCIVPGMPGEAIRIGAAGTVQRPEHIGESLSRLWG